MGVLVVVDWPVVEFCLCDILLIPNSGSTLFWYSGILLVDSSESISSSRLAEQTWLLPF